MAKLVDRYLANYITWRRWISIARSLALAAMIAICWAVFWCLLDRGINLPAVVRAIALVVGCTVAVLIFARPILFLHRKPDLVAAAIEIESRQPIFDQRLVTVASHPSSDSIMLSRLRDEVQTIIALRAGRGAVSRRPLVLPLLGLTASLLIAVTMFLLPQLDFPSLLQRFFRPLAGLPPVTITRIYVQPGSVSIIEGKTLIISAAIEHSDQSTCTLHVSDDGQTWTELPMPAKPDTVGTFSTSIPSMGHDLRYYITTGDAVSNTFTATLLRPPGVVEYFIHCDPPPTSHRPAFNIINNDGNFAAPIGSKLTIDITSTEPLQSGFLLVGHDAIFLVATSNPSIRRAKLTLHHDLRYQARLTALNSITTTSPHASVIQAIKPVDATQRSSVPGFDEQLKLYFQTLDRAATQPSK